MQKIEVKSTFPAFLSKNSEFLFNLMFHIGVHLFYSAVTQPRPRLERVLKRRYRINLFAL